MTKPLSCPFCGSEPEERHKNFFRCMNKNCFFNDNVRIYFWNKRVSPWRTIEEEMPPLNVQSLAVENIRSTVIIGTFEPCHIGDITFYDTEDIPYELDEITMWMPIPEMEEIK